MTDPKAIQELAKIVRAAPLVLPGDAAVIAATLDAYARILAASPDAREIEERNRAAIAEVEALNPLAGIVVTRAQRDCATLLDVVRRKDAEIERIALDLRLANEELKRLRVEHDHARVELNEAEAKIVDQDERIAQLHSQREEARTALQEERERHAGTRAEVDGLLSERTALTEAMGIQGKPDKQRSHITLMTQARGLRMSQEKRGLFVGKVVRDLCAALPEYKKKTGTLHARWLECIAELRARLAGLEAYAREVETVAAAIIETSQREKYAGIDALISQAEKLISEHGAAVGK